jgi:hypothetical protein
MSPIIKKAQHRGKAPILETLAKYLEKEEGREACLLLDASGQPVAAEDLAGDFGGGRAAHWHTIVSPTFEDCAILTERHGGDRQAAAIAHGVAMARRLERDGGRRVAFAVHLEDRGGKPHFHYHFVGQGEPRMRLYGRSGVLQRAWDREWAPDRKAIVDWGEHRAFLKTRADLRSVQQDLRNLGEDRRQTIAAAPPEEKGAAREGFRERELALVARRYELEVEAIHHRYAARNDLGSEHHQAELVDAANRRKGAETRAAHRGQPREVVRGSRLAAGIARSAATHPVKAVLRQAGQALTVGAAPSQVAQANEAPLKAAQAAVATIAQTAATLALRAASANPPGLAFQAARIALTAPQKVLEAIAPERGKLPDELALPLRAASAVPGLGLLARTATLTAEITLKPMLKEAER